MESAKLVAIYARVSTEDQAEFGFSIDAQLDTLGDYARIRGKVVFDKYVDRGLSGSNLERPELKRMLADAEAGNFDEVLVYRINRISRDQYDLMHVMKQLERLGIGFESFSEKFDTTTPMGKFALQMMGAVGELERNTIVENVKVGMKQRARTGQWNGGIVLGYRTKVVPEGSNRRERKTKLEVVPEEAALVRKIFELYASGKGLKAIVNQLNHEGHVTRKGNPFGVYGIADILKNPLYVGKIRYNVRENWSKQRRKGSNKNTIIADGQHEQIISQELWDRVQVLYTKKSGKSPRVFQGSFPLTGLLRCPQCGSGMVAHRVKDKLKDGTIVYRRYYVCGAFQNKGSAVCSYNGVKADPAEQAVLDRLRLAVTNPKVLQDVVDKINHKRSDHHKPLEAEVASIKKALSLLKKKRDKWYSLYENDDGIDREMLVTRLNDFKDEAERLESRRSELLAALGTVRTAPVPLPLVKTALTQFHRLVSESPPEQQKALFHMLIKRIEVRDRKVGSLEICLDERIERSFFEAAPSGSLDGAFNFREVLPLSITL